MRKCKVDNGKNEWNEDAMFHEWGHEAEEGSQGNGGIMWSSAIVEGADGRIRLLPPEWIKFEPAAKRDGGER